MTAKQYRLLINPKTPTPKAMTYSDLFAAAIDELAQANELLAFCDKYIANEMLEELAAALSNEPFN